jgi:peptidoglycan/xylan/chitin deacetylase (PgdA/CDA1 family)
MLALLLGLVLAVTLSASSHHGASPAARRAGGSGQAAPPVQPPGLPAQENNAISHTLAYTQFVREGAGRVPEVALTFDDGPGPYTPGVLSVLERLHVRATFFPIGKMELYFSDSTVRALHDGDVIGNHTETHPALARLSAREQREQLAEQSARIELLSGPRPRLFRPPYGSFNAITLRQLRRMGLLMVLWSADTGDYLQPGVAAIEQRALEALRPGAIILMHDGGGDRSQTIAALPLLIKKIRARGYRLVTVPELLRDDPPPPGQQLPPGLSGD